MPRYSIVRNVPGLTQEELDAASMRAIWCLSDFPEMRWVRSYWDQESEQLLCVYDSPNVQMIQDHSSSARIPCDDVHEVWEFGPDTYLTPAEVGAVPR